jgi:hypothetical protein
MVGGEAGGGEADDGSARDRESGGVHGNGYRRAAKGLSSGYLEETVRGTVI